MTLTAILPLRTTEFLLTPRERLSEENGKTIITLRRTLLKGGGRKLSYKVDKDYEAVRYMIPSKMAADISWYLNATVSMSPSVLSTLFVREPHYEHFLRMPNSSLGYYTYANLSRALDVSKMMSWALTRARLGDTRHPAIISPETFALAQYEISRRKPHVWHSNSPHRKVIWQCGGKYKRKTYCRTPHLASAELERVFIAAFNLILG